MPAPAYGCRERLQAEPDEVRSARDPDSGEHRLRRGDEGGDAGASGERPQRLADRNTLRGAETVRASAEKRVPDRQRRVRPRRTDHHRREQDERDHPRTSGLYLIRCGSSASGPRVSFIQSTYSPQAPSTQIVSLFPSKARMWVATRSRNQRSWVITTAQPANSSNASSSARSVSTSRSLVGSSSRRTLPPARRSFARWTRFRSPPERSETRFC